MKKLFMLIVSCGLCIATVNSAFAAAWQQDSIGWWYQEDDGSYPADTWCMIDGKSYYFGSDGYMYADRMTPDGYKVDASGAWVEHWIENQVTYERITLIPKNGFVKEQNAYFISGELAEFFEPTTEGLELLMDWRIVQDNITMKIDSSTEFGDNGYRWSEMFPAYRSGDTVLTWFERYVGQEYYSQDCYEVDVAGDCIVKFYGVFATH